MSIKFYDTSEKYWGKFDETRGLFIPSEKVLADCKTDQTERPCDNCQEFDCYGCEHKQTEREGE